MNLCSLFVILVTQIFVNKNEAKTANIQETNNFTAVKEIKLNLPPQVYKKTAELLHMINKIHNGENGDNVKSVKTRDSQGYVDLKPIDVDYFGIGINKGTALRSLMKMIQKNYDSNKAFDNVNARGVRMHVINNPEVLEMYKTNLRSKEERAPQVNSIVFHSQSTSSSSSDEDLYDDESDSRRAPLRDILSTLRRQAVFRIDNPSSTEYKERISSEITENDIKVTKNFMKSTEDDHLQYTEHKIEKNIDSIDLDNRKRERAINEKEYSDNWDIITQKYDWEAKDMVDNEDVSIKNNKQKNDWDYYPKKEMSKSKFDFRDDKTTKKANWQNDRSENEDEIENFNKKWDQSKVFDSGNGKKKSTNNDWDKWRSKKDFEDQNAVAIKKDWDELPRKKKGKGFTNDINNKRNRDVNKSWNEKSKKVKIIYDWDNVANAWGKSAKSPGSSRMRTTRRQWKKPDLKVNEWNNFMTKGRRIPKKHENIKRNGPVFTGFGQTPIPFVGRHGVYEDE